MYLRTQMWRFIRRLQNAFNFELPVPRNLFFPFVQAPLGRSRSSTRATALDAINFIFSFLPSKRALPLNVLSASIVAILTALTNTWVAYDIAIDKNINNEVFSKDPKCQTASYDYIVVGGGTAGMIVATRIANASRNIRVLLLEAGGDPFILNDVPAFDFYLMRQPANTWNYKSTPQKHVCQNCNGHKPVTTRGKMLGGSTSTNFMLYARGNKEDFNRWAFDANDEQWNYQNVLPYFKKSEDYHGEYENDPKSDLYHGKGGLLNIATHSYMPGAKEFLAAGLELGYKIGDYNGEDQNVFSKMDVTTQEGWRESVYRAYYEDTGRPSNLCIKKYAEVTKIHFDSLNGRKTAVGVTYKRHANTGTVTALKEVVLSAGVFGSPKLLLLSGIGPANDLMSLGIPVVKDLPVGQNLQDHAYALVGPFMRGPATNLNKDFTLKTLARFGLQGEGVGAAPAGFAGHAFFQSPVAFPPYPDLQAIKFSISLYPETPNIMNGFLGIREDVLDRWLYPYHKKNVDSSWLVILLGRPKSTGYLTLSTKNPSDPLIIDPKYLEHPDDQDALLYGFKKIVQLFENTTALNTPLFPKPVPGCENEVFKSDSYFRCVIKHMSGSFYHHVGTCALGKVVDSSLKVKGIDGLRVIDASIMPRTPNGNTMAAAIMIGEKGADLIMKDLLNPNINLDFNTNEFIDYL